MEEIRELRDNLRVKMEEYLAKILTAHNNTIECSIALQLSLISHMTDSVTITKIVQQPEGWIDFYLDYDEQPWSIGWLSIDELFKVISEI